MNWLKSQDENKIQQGGAWKQINAVILALGVDGGVEIITPLNVVEKEKINSRLIAYRLMA
jgi:hypothetical protein